MLSETSTLEIVEPPLKRIDLPKITSTNAIIESAFIRGTVTNKSLVFNEEWFICNG